jgi:hypothetical protein
MTGGSNRLRARAAALSMAAAVAALGTAGCGHVEMHELVLRAPEGPAGRAEVYFAGQDPRRPYYEVALLQGIGFGDDADVEHVARALAVRAGALGCDAVVRVRVDQGFTRAHGFGVCVRWSPIAPRPVERPPLTTPSQRPPLTAPGDETL